MGTEQLTLPEETTFIELEAIVQRNRWAFVQAGNALAEIRFRRLYRAKHTTFESYCAERWGFKRRTAYAYLEAATVAENVHTCAQNPPSLSQARELAVLQPEQQREVAAEVDFATTPVRKLKKRIAQVKAGTKSIPDDPSFASAAIATEESKQEPGVPMIRREDLCQQCRERLFPEEKQVAESAPGQTPIVEYQYDAEYSQAEPLVEAQAVPVKTMTRYRI